MEGFLHHMAPQFLHPALQSYGCGAFRPIAAAAGAFHPLYPTKAFARHLGEQYALGQSVGQALRVRDNSTPPPLYRHVGASGYAAAAAAAAAAMAAAARDDTSSPGSAASDPCKEEEPSGPATVTSANQNRCTDEHHDFLGVDGERKLNCGVCGTRLGPGVAQAHFLQELQHLYSLSALPRDAPPQGLHHQDEDARWETYQRIRANRQRRLRLRTRKRHHTVESMLSYEPDEQETRMPAPSSSVSRPQHYDIEDEPVDVEGDSIGWPEGAMTTGEGSEKGSNAENENAMKQQLNYTEDLEISSTNDSVQNNDIARPRHPARQLVLRSLYFQYSRGGSNIEKISGEPAAPKQKLNHPRQDPRSNMELSLIVVNVRDVLRRFLLKRRSRALKGGAEAKRRFGTILVMGTPKSQTQECTATNLSANQSAMGSQDVQERPHSECVSTSWNPRVNPLSSENWSTLAAEAYLQATRHHKMDGENMPSSTDPHN